MTNIIEEYVFSGAGEEGISNFGAGTVAGGGGGIACVSAVAVAVVTAAVAALST